MMIQNNLESHALQTFESDGLDARVKHKVAISPSRLVVSSDVVNQSDTLGYLLVALSQCLIDYLLKGMTQVEV